MHQLTSKIRSRYPNIADNIVAFWGTDILNQHLNEIIIQGPNDTTEGFPYDIFFDLLLIQAIHHTVCPTERSWVKEQLERKE